jgi:hypothetical protein
LIDKIQTLIDKSGPYVSQQESHSYALAIAAVKPNSPDKQKIARPSSNKEHTLTTAGDQSKVGPTSDTKLVHLFSPIPHATTALRNCHQLIRDSLRKVAVTALVGGVDDPPDGSSPTLSLHERDGNLHGRTTTSNTLLLADLDQRSHRVHDQRKIEDGVQGELRTRGTGEQTTLRVGLGRRGGAEMVQNEGHVLE